MSMNINSLRYNTTMVRKWTFLCVCLLFLSAPLSLHAAVNAGVVDGIWFSKPNPKTGEKIKLFTAVQNQSTSTVSGTVIFLVNKKVIGSAPFSVASNSVIPVAIPYTFTGDGKQTVSAYITTSPSKTSIVYTTVSDTPISVSRGSSPITVTKTSSDYDTSNIQKEVHTLIDKGKQTTKKITPAVHKAIEKVEALRDKVVTQTATSTKSTDEKSSPDLSHQNTNATLSIKDSLTQTAHDIKSIFTIKDLPLWKKFSGSGLSVAIMILKLWYMWLTLLLILFFWKAVRGKRIR